MIIKLDKIISCSSEHPSYPASNLLKYHTDTSWRCAKPGEMLAYVIFQLAEPSCIIGLDIGNYHSCVVIVTASTSSEPDKWIPVINHQFMTHDEAVDGKFKDQVQLFTKKELNPEILKIKFDRVKVTCMQSANLKELFGLSFITLRTEVTIDLSLDVFGRFKLKAETDKPKRTFEELREKYLKESTEKKNDYKQELLMKARETSMNNFSKKQDEDRPPMKRPLLEKLENGKANEVFKTNNKTSNVSQLDEKKQETSKKTSSESLINTSKESNVKPVLRTPFGDIITSPQHSKTIKDKKNETNNDNTTSKKRTLSSDRESSPTNNKHKKQICSQCSDETEDQLCKTCNRVLKPKTCTEAIIKKKPKEKVKPKILFEKLFEGKSFSLSGYVNPQRDEIRRKALHMGARYIADPNTTDRKCTYLICAFRNTPKLQQLKGHCKIVKHTFIEDCYDKKVRFPWRRYALTKEDKNQSESEEEVEGSTSPIRETSLFDVDTDSDSEN